MALATALVHLALMFVFAWPCTDASQYAGVHRTYDAALQPSDYSYSYTPSRAAELNTSCNADCACRRDQKHFSPVCVTQNGRTVTFFSACFAGCKARRDNNSYYDCSCLQNSSFANATLGYGEDGSCVHACSHLPIIYLMIFVAFFLSIATAIPNISSVLACFPEQYKSVACSLQWLSLRLFGSIIASLIYAELIKNACIFHVDASADSACLLYDHTKFGWAMAAPSVVYKAFSIFFVLCALVSELRREKAERLSLAACERRKEDLNAIARSHNDADASASPQNDHRRSEKSKDTTAPVSELLL